MIQSSLESPLTYYKRGYYAIHTCSCGNTSIIKCTKRYWYDGYKCQSCTNKDTGIRASKQWNNPSYKEKWKKTRNSTKSIRSLKSKQIWSNKDRLSELSVKVKKAWENEEYRAVKTEQSQKLWENQEYISKQKEGYTESVRKMMALKRSEQPRISSIQIKLYQYLDALGVEYYKEGEKTSIGYYVFDCVIPRIYPNKSILIECQGDYWHSMPETERKDRAKFTYIDKYFPEYEIMYIWENEFSTKDGVIDRLKLKLGIDINIIDFEFSKLDIRIPTTDELKNFLDLYHYLGHSRTGINFGAYLDNKLISVVIYSSPLRQNVAAQFDLENHQVRELSRFCIHPSYHKRNFASWFITKTLKSIDSDCIVAYCDQTVGHTGSIYKACGFIEHHKIAPDYWYVDKNNYIMHKRTLYGRACKMSSTEREFAEKFGYKKIFGGPKICFVKFLGK